MLILVFLSKKLTKLHLSVVHTGTFFLRQSHCVTDEAIRDVLGDALYLIRFPQMHPKEFTDGSEADSVAEGPEADDVLTLAVSHTYVDKEACRRLRLLNFRKSTRSSAGTRPEGHRRPPASHTRHATQLGLSHVSLQRAAIAAGTEAKTCSSARVHNAGKARGSASCASDVASPSSQSASVNGPRTRAETTTLALTPV